MLYHILLEKCVATSFEQLRGCPRPFEQYKIHNLSCQHYLRVRLGSVLMLHNAYKIMKF